LSERVEFVPKRCVQECFTEKMEIYDKLRAKQASLKTCLYFER